MNSLVTEIVVPRYGLAWYPWACSISFWLPYRIARYG